MNRGSDGLDKQEFEALWASMRPRFMNRGSIDECEALEKGFLLQ